MAPLQPSYRQFNRPGRQKHKHAARTVARDKTSRALAPYDVLKNSPGCLVTPDCTTLSGNSGKKVRKRLEQEDDGAMGQ